MSSDEPILDGKRIREQRHIVGLSVRRLAVRLSTSATTITRLEAGTNHAELPLRMTTELARALGLAPSELFAYGADKVPQPGPDDQTIEAALMIAGSATSISELARALGWELARVHHALERLETRLGNTGVRLHDHGWQRYALRPATERLSQDQQHALHRIGPLHRGLTAETASMLHAVAEDSVTNAWHRTASSGEQIALQSLLKQELITTGVDGRFQITDIARFGLYPET